MAAIDRLLKFISKTNISDDFDEEKKKEIAECIVTGYQVDDESRQRWLDTNKKAIALIKTADEDDEQTVKNFPFQDASRVVYQLLSPAVIQLSSRMIQHVVRNNRVAECAVLGQDFVDPNTGLGVKEQKAKRVSNFLSYEMLVESSTWLTDEHKLNTIVAAWGIGFKEVYYDPISKKNCSELLPPEDVIINNNVTSLEKAPRITIRKYLTANEIESRIRSGEFNEIDLTKINTTIADNRAHQNDSRDETPVYEFLKQYTYCDLDEDGYDEPYCVIVEHQSKQLAQIYPCYDIKDIHIDQTNGTILRIDPQFNIIDRHLLDDPQGKYYSIGLNHLLYHPAKTLTAILRQLVDAGTLANTAASSGFVTKALKVKERNIRVKLGEFIPVDLAPNASLADQFYNMPFREPSQVLLGLLQLMIQNAKETGFITDILAGDTQMQNVPATTMLAAVEQSTRAFKPVVQKLFQSLKNEFRTWFKLYGKYLDRERYFKFQDGQDTVSQDDFDLDNLDVSPVADPTMSSEAHKYARLQALMQLLQTNAAGAINIQQALEVIFNELQFPDPANLIAPPSPPQQDPKIAVAQINAQQQDKDRQLDGMKLQIQQLKEQVRAINESKKLELHQQEILIEAHKAGANIQKTKADIKKDLVNAASQVRSIHVADKKVEVERERNKLMAESKRNPSSPSEN